MKKTMLEHTLDMVGLPPHEEPEGDFIKYYTLANTIAVPLAFVISYYRHRHIGWAVTHSLLGVPYLGYLTLKSITPTDE